MLIDDRHANVSFLLSLCSLAAGCAVGGDNPVTSGPPVVDPTTDGGDTEPADTGSGADTGTSVAEVDGPQPTDDGPPPGTTTDEPPADSTTGEYACDQAPMVGAISQACIAYTAASNECFYEGGLTPECIAAYEAWCQYYLDKDTTMYGDACGAAVEDFLVCLSQLPCEQLADMVDDCPEQLMALDTACGGM
jgi:hypothetical protein